MKDLQDCAKLFKNGKIGVIPTDTIYGISASVFSLEAVEKIYAVKGRDLQKPCIILISSWDDLKLLELEISEEKKAVLEKKWPGKVSVILSCQSQKLSHLHRGKKTLCIRFPDKKDLAELLQKTGPLVSTSANPEGEIPAKNIQEAQKYFGGKIDFYFDAGELDGHPSELFDFTGEEMRKIER